MIACDFCLHYTIDGQCSLGLTIAKAMTCREFGPGIDKFCSNPKDFVDSNQIVEMATFFGFQRMELKKVKQMASRTEQSVKLVPDNY